MTRARNNVSKLFDEQDGKCFYCDVEMLWTPIVDGKYRKEYTELQATFDHVKVKSKGGTYAKDNGVCACWKCNTMRSDLPQDVFIKHRAFLTEQWKMGNRTPSIRPDGELICISLKRFKRFKKNEKKRARNSKKAGFIIARYAMQIGKTVEDLFHENIYNSTYEMMKDLALSNRSSDEYTRQI